MTSESSLVGQSLKDNNANILKMVLAVAMIVEGGGENEVGARLYESVKEHADAILHQEGVELKSLPLLVLVVSCRSMSPYGGRHHSSYTRKTICVDARHS
jgi:hypothetical protein